MSNADRNPQLETGEPLPPPNQADEENAGEYEASSGGESDPQKLQRAETVARAKEHRLFLLGGWKRQQYWHLLITLLAVTAVFGLGGAFIPGMLAAFATLAALVVAGPVLPWVLLLVTAALLGLEIGLLAAAGTLSSMRIKEELWGDPESRQVLYSRLAIGLGLLLGALLVPFLALTLFPGLLAALAATAIFPAMPWLLLGLIGLLAGAVVLGIIVAVLDVSRAVPGFTREFFGSLRGDAGQRLSFERVDTTSSLREVPARDLSPILSQDLDEPEPSTPREFKRVKVTLIDYTAGEEAKFFSALARYLDENRGEFAEDGPHVETGSHTLAAEPQYLAVSPVGELKALCGALAGQVSSLTLSQVDELDAAVLACRHVGVKEELLQPVAEKLGQYKAAAIVTAIEQEPETFISWIDTLPKNGVGDKAVTDYKVVLADIPSESLQAMQQSIGNMLVASESKSISGPSKQALWRSDKVKLEGFNRAIEDRINHLKQLASASDVSASVGS